MQMVHRYGLLILLILYSSIIHARQDSTLSIQFDPLPSGKVVLPFELINNLVVIKLQINDSSPLNFILDTGVRRTLISELPENEEFTLFQVEKVALRGLGGKDPIYGFRSPNNQLRLSNSPVRAFNAEVIVLERDLLHLSKVMGTFVHGIIGYDLFSSFMIEVDYNKKHLILYESDNLKKIERLKRSRHWHEIPIAVEDYKAYLSIFYQHGYSSNFKQLKLLIDTGSSGALTIYAPSGEFPIPENNVGGLLGVGLGGEIFGKLGRVATADLGPFRLNEPVVSYPDSSFAHDYLSMNNRNGSIGSEVLRRFKILYNYKQKVMLMKARSNIMSPYNYNASGVVISTPFPNVPVYMIARVRKGSLADKAGLIAGDQIERIHGNTVFNKSLSDITEYFREGNNHWIKVEVSRDSTLKSVKFPLENVLKIDP